MFKTVFAVRDGRIDSCMTVEWPELIKPETIESLALARNETKWETMRAVLPNEVIEFCQNFSSMQLRIRFNMMQGPFIVDSDHKPTDQELLQFAKTHSRSTNLKGK